MSLFKKSLILVFLLLIIDQTIKIWIKLNMYYGEDLIIIGNWARIHFIENPGMAFGFVFGGDAGKLILSIFRLIAITALVWYLYTISLNNPAKRDYLIENLRKNNIGTGVYYSTPLHLMPLFRDLYGFKGGEFQISEKASKSVLSIPVYPGIKKDEMEFIANKVRELCLSI